MSTFRDISAAACFLGIVFSIMGNLIPSEKFSGQLRGIFALVLILVIVPRILAADISFDLGDSSAYSYEEAGEKIRRLLDEAIPQNICDSLEEILNDENIYPREISVNVNNSPDGSISIISAEIILEPSDSPDSERVRRIASEALGTDKITVKAE